MIEVSVPTTQIVSLISNQRVFTCVFISMEKYDSEQALKTISQNDAHIAGGPGLTPTLGSHIEHSSNSHK